MRVGILTFHRANNYGAVLQCYALQESLRSVGYDTVVVNYKQPFIEQVYERFSWQYLFTLLTTRPQAVIIYLMNCGARDSVRPLFNNFRDKFLRLTAECYGDDIPQNIDTYIIGSDQLWSNNCTNGIDPIYYGEFIRPLQSRVLGYAISSNAQSIKRLSDDKLRLYSQNFETLSLRETEIFDIVNSRCTVSSRVDIDPTLLLEASQWEAITNPRWESRQYVLLYQLRTKKGRGAKLRRKAQELANNMKCELIDISSGNYSVEDFVSLFKYAQYVVTSSFHGTAFSVIFERPLYSVILNDGHDGRCKNLLKSIGAEELLVELNDFTPKPRSINYATITPQIDALRAISMDYLSKFVKYE